MDGQPLVSVLINNYNYGRFLADAIDSALDQTYARVEVIVVDDGSTDDSRDVIASYGNRIVPVLKENGGQASAFNAGFAASRGALICFLDADDWFAPAKVATVVADLQTHDMLECDVLAYHPLELMNESGTVLGPRRAHPHVYQGNYYASARKYRYLPYTASTSSGIALTRSLGRRIFPVPERFPSGADNFVVRAAGLLGTIHFIEPRLGRYRAHGQNRFWGNPTPKPREFWEYEEAFLNAKLLENGLQPVICIYESIYARSYYLDRRDWQWLLRLALRVPSHHLDQLTLRFSLKTLFLAGMTAARSHVLRPGRPAEG